MISEANPAIWALRNLWVGGSGVVCLVLAVLILRRRRNGK